MGAVDELQKLQGELNIAQTTGAQLDVAIHFVLRDKRYHAASHRTHFRNEPGTSTSRPHKRRDFVFELFAQFWAPSNRARLQ